MKNSCRETEIADNLCTGTVLIGTSHALEILEHTIRNIPPPLVHISKPQGEPPLNWSTIVTNERPPEEYHNLDNDQPADTVKPNQQVQQLWVQDHIKWTPNLHHPNPTHRGAHTNPEKVDSTPRKPTVSWLSPVLSIAEIAQKQPVISKNNQRYLWNQQEHFAAS